MLVDASAGSSSLLHTEFPCVFRLPAISVLSLIGMILVKPERDGVTSTRAPA